MNQETREIIFSVQDLHRSYAKVDVLRGITLGFYYGAKIGIIGRNGSGKSTLLRIIAGEDRGYEGVVTVAKGVRVGYVPQEPTLDETKDVRGNIEEGVASVRALLEEYDQVTARLAEDLSDEEMQKAYDRMAALQDRIEACDGWDIDRHVEQAMHALICPPGDSAVSHLSGGEKRRVALCRTLMSYPDILLLDEPTNHLDADTVAWLERHLAAYPGTVLLITHDRYFLDTVVGWMLELDKGRGNPFQGNYSQYLEQKAATLAQEERGSRNLQKLLERELEWIRQTPRGRMKKSKARISNYGRLVDEAKERSDDGISLSIPAGRRLGDRVIRFQGVSKSYPDHPLMEKLSFELPPGGIVGVIGPNGVGKTTLLRLIMGQEQPDAGTVEIGDTVDLCYVDQSREDLVDSNTIFEEISDGKDTFKVGRREVATRAYMARFGFTGDQQEKRVGDLSGGQRNRVLMAKMLRRGGNVILLDEPTNDLDIPTLRLLEEALQEFPGCAVAVSHDRYFLDRIATHILAFEGDGEVHLFEGSYQAYAEHMAREREERGESAEFPRGAHRRFR